jgi:hypothetical protein
MIGFLNPAKIGGNWKFGVIIATGERILNYE